MKKQDEQALYRYWHTLRSECRSSQNPIAADTACPRAVQARKELLSSLSQDITEPGTFNAWLKRECAARDEEGLDLLFQLGYIFELFDAESVEILAPEALSDWHHEAEEMIPLFEEHPNAFTNERLYQMALQKYPGQYYGDQGEYIPRKCIWALWRLGGADALDKIRKLSRCGDPVVERYAKHQLEKLRED